MNIIKESRSLVIDRNTLSKLEDSWGCTLRPANEEQIEWLPVLDKYIRKRNPVYVEFGAPSDTKKRGENKQDYHARLLCIDETRICARILFKDTTDDGGYDVEFKPCGPLGDQVEHLLHAKKAFAISMKGYATHRHDGDNIIDQLDEITAMNILINGQLQTPIPSLRLSKLGYPVTTGVVMESLPIGQTIMLTFDKNGNLIPFTDQQNDMN